nr:hypothetical protein [Armatimonas sp.]
MTLNRLVRNALTLLLLAVPCLLLLPRLKTPVALPPAAMEQVLVSRYTAANNRLGTPFIRPLDASRLTAYGDGALPDMRHGILYTGLVAVSMKALQETRGGQGQRAATLLGIFLLLSSSLVTLWLARRWFPQRDGRRAALLFVWSGGAILATVLPGPGLLLALLGALLYATLVPLDVRMSSKRAPLSLAIIAGVLWGLLFLTIYSALLLLPLLFWHLIRVTRRDVRVVLAFGVAASIVAAPQLLRAYKFAHNPLFHSRGLELTMRTESYPGTTLYHATSLPATLTSYLSRGGHVEVVARTGHTLTALVPRSMATLGLALLLFLTSSLIRFTDDRLNTLRRLLLLALPLHLAALSLFFPAEECAEVLLLYAPAVAVLAAGFLETVVHARRLPRLHSRGVLLLWTFGCCLSGIAQLLALRAAPAPPRLYSFLGASGKYLEQIQTQGDGVLAADDALAMAYYANIPVTLLPTSATDFLELERQLHKEIVGFGITPSIRWDRPENAAIQPWAETYRRVIGLFSLSELLPTAESNALRTRISYPQELLPAIQKFQVTPIKEPQFGNDFSAFFWDLDYVKSQPR